MHKTYLGQKGYSIYKNTLSVKEAVYIREELMVKPYLPKSPVHLSHFLYIGNLIINFMYLEYLV